MASTSAAARAALSGGGAAAESCWMCARRADLAGRAAGARAEACAAGAWDSTRGRLVGRAAEEGAACPASDGGAAAVRCSSAGAVGSCSAGAVGRACRSPGRACAASAPCPRTVAGIGATGTGMSTTGAPMAKLARSTGSAAGAGPESAALGACGVQLDGAHAGACRHPRDVLCR